MTKKMERMGWVYVIQGIGTNHYKIGYTKDEPSRRFKELKTGSPNGLKVIFTFPGTMNDEAMLHEACSRFQRHGEWFEFKDPASFIAVIVKTVLGVDVAPRLKMNEDTVREFVRDNFLIGRKPPEDKYDGYELGVLQDKFYKFCRFKDIEVPNQKEFRDEMAKLKIGRKKFEDKTYYKMEIKPGSELIDPDF